MVPSTQLLARVEKPSPIDLSRITVPPRRGDARAVARLERSEAGRTKDAVPLAAVAGTLFPITRWGRGAGRLSVMEITA